jgi:hypothetical protein
MHPEVTICLCPAFPKLVVCLGISQLSFTINVRAFITSMRFEGTSRPWLNILLRYDCTRDELSFEE